LERIESKGEGAALKTLFKHPPSPSCADHLEKNGARKDKKGLRRGTEETDRLLVTIRTSDFAITGWERRQLKVFNHIDEKRGNSEGTLPKERAIRYRKGSMSILSTKVREMEKEGPEYNPIKTRGKKA